jgi:nitrite reductase (NADH) small subunit/3-phenylpropionate/trans-cinnamate dioxygenase ferredoxin subunit
MAWTSLCDFEELVENEGKYVEIEGFHLAVFLSGGKISVIDDHCPHAGGNLSGGIVEDGCAICPWHAWAFRLDNGQLRGAPGVAVSTYESRVYDYQGRRVVQAELPSV